MDGTGCRMDLARECEPGDSRNFVGTEHWVEHHWGCCDVEKRKHNTRPSPAPPADHDAACRHNLVYPGGERNQRFTCYRFPFSPARIVTASTSVSNSELLV